MSSAVINWVYNFIGDRRASMLVDGVFTECQITRADTATLPVS